MGASWKSEDPHSRMGKEPHIVGVCACYKFDDLKMCVHPCTFIGETEFGGKLFCEKKRKFYDDDKLPKRCVYRKLERNASYEDKNEEEGQ